MDYVGYVFPWWGEGVGWFLAISSMICVPVYAIYLYMVTPGTFSEVCTLAISLNYLLMCYAFGELQRMKAMFRPDIPEIEEEIRQRSLKDTAISVTQV